MHKFLTAQLVIASYLYSVGVCVCVTESIQNSSHATVKADNESHLIVIQIFNCDHHENESRMHTQTQVNPSTNQKYY